MAISFEQFLERERAHYAGGDWIKDQAFLYLDAAEKQHADTADLFLGCASFEPDASGVILEELRSSAVAINSLRRALMNNDPATIKTLRNAYDQGPVDLFHLRTQAYATLPKLVADSGLEDGRHTPRK